MKKLLVALVTVVAVVGGLAVAFYRADIPVAELERTYADDASRFAEVDGLRVHYKDEGEGQVLVLLHGFASSLHTWDGWAEELRGDFRVVRLDLPGHGLTDPRLDGDYRSETFAEFLGHFLDHLGIESCVLAGNSMGGEISWLFTARHGERVSKLVLLDATGAPRDPTAADAATKGSSAVLSFIQAPGIRQLVPRITPRFLVKDALREVYGDDSLVTEELVERYYQLTLRAGNRDALVALLQNRGEDLSGLVAGIAAPTLVLWGSEDQWIPVAHAERFHVALPSSELVIYFGVGHLPQEESPLRSADDVRAFLAGES
jgi:pimeloyl-ACP methyl ester carboxylesterase